MRDPLPGGFRLARQLKVSRPTIRIALLQLAKEGLIVVQQGRRPRRATPRTSVSSPVDPAVCVVWPAPFDNPFIAENPVLLEMHAEFASREVRWEAIFEERLDRPQPEARLQQLVAARPNVCWILVAAPEPIHRWFASKQLPTLVLGSAPAGLDLPSVDIDYGAVGWHAAGTIVAHGHRQIVLMMPAKPLPGDVATRTSFLRYFEQRAPHAVASAWQVPDDLEQLRAGLDRLFKLPIRPTVVLSLRPTHTFAILLHILGSGLRIPQDISIVSRDTHPMFDSSMPELARYNSTALENATRAVKIAMRILGGRKVRPIPTLVPATFVPGKTLARLNDGMRRK